MKTIAIYAQGATLCASCSYGLECTRRRSWLTECAGYQYEPGAAG